jgi:hypothetical protein
MRFKSTQNIFKDFGEVFDINWMDSDKVVYPPKYDWDYARELQVEDVDIWEVIYEQGGAVGVYAAWCPYAEFYLVRVGWQKEAQGWGAETYYGPGAQKRVQARMKELGIPFFTNKIWVAPEDMYLYEGADSGNLKTIHI